MNEIINEVEFHSKEIGYGSHKLEVLNSILKRSNVLKLMFDTYQLVGNKEGMLDCLARHEELELLFNELTKDID